MRALAAVLLLANLGWLALAQGWLQPYVGLSSQHQREPQRLAAQMNADSVRVVAVGEAASAPAPVPAPVSVPIPGLGPVPELALRCLRAGPFSSEQIEAVEAALAPTLQPPAAWQRHAAGAAGEVQFWLLVEQPDAALRQQLQERVAAVPGSSLSACTAPR